MNDRTAVVRNMLDLNFAIVGEEMIVFVGCWLKGGHEKHYNIVLGKGCMLANEVLPPR